MFPSEGCMTRTTPGQISYRGLQRPSQDQYRVLHQGSVLVGQRLLQALSQGFAVAGGQIVVGPEPGLQWPVRSLRARQGFTAVGLRSLRVPHPAAGHDGSGVCGSREVVTGSVGIRSGRAKVIVGPVRVHCSRKVAVGSVGICGSQSTGRCRPFIAGKGNRRAGSKPQG